MKERVKAKEEDDQSGEPNYYVLYTSAAVEENSVVIQNLVTPLP